jgi:hypothetical protein
MPAFKFVMAAFRSDRSNSASDRIQISCSAGADLHSAVFKTAPLSDQSVRLIVYSDSETEPELSITDPVDWPVSTGSNRPEGVTKYFVNQTIGYRANCDLIQLRKPDLILLFNRKQTTTGLLQSRRFTYFRYGRHGQSYDLGTTNLQRRCHNYAAAK